VHLHFAAQHFLDHETRYCIRKKARFEGWNFFHLIFTSTSLCSSRRGLPWSISSQSYTSVRTYCWHIFTTAAKGFDHLLWIGMPLKLHPWQNWTWIKSDSSRILPLMSRLMVRDQFLRFIPAALMSSSEPRFQEIREQHLCEDEHYFIAQLYEEGWTPRATSA
jgi:hypothetical protein